VPSVGSTVPAASSALKNALPKVASMPMTSPVERISGPSAVSTSGKRLNGSTHSLIATEPWSDFSHSSPSTRSSASVAPIITRDATFASGTPVAFATNGTVRLARGFASITCTVVPVTAYCTLIRPRTSSAAAIDRVYDSITSTPIAAASAAGSRTRSPAVNARLLDVLHHSADQHLTRRVADRVDVDLRPRPRGSDRSAPDAPAESPPSRPRRAHPGELGHRACEVVVVVDDLHAATAEHVARTHEHREADGRPRSSVPRRAVAAGPARRLRDAQLLAQRVPLLAFLGEVDRCRRRAGDSSLGRSPASFSGVWPPSDTITFGATPPAAGVSARARCARLRR
jgi:hypothetical protein